MMRAGGSRRDILSASPTPFCIFIETLHREQEMWSEGLRASPSRKLRRPHSTGPRSQPLIGSHIPLRITARLLFVFKKKFITTFALASVNYCTLRQLSAALLLPEVGVTEHRYLLSLYISRVETFNLDSRHFNANICNFYSFHSQNRLVALVLMHF